MRCNLSIKYAQCVKFCKLFSKYRYLWTLKIFYIACLHENKIRYLRRNESFVMCIIHVNTCMHSFVICHAARVFKINIYIWIMYVTIKINTKYFYILVFRDMNNIWGSAQYNTSIKLKLYHSCVVFTLLYGSECWRITGTDLFKLRSFHTTWYACTKYFEFSDQKK